MKKLNIGLFGFGCVGQGLYEVLNGSVGIDADILKIAVKDKNKKRRLPNEIFTFDASEILENPDINLIVELIDDAEAAYYIVTQALKSGKNVVTANKKMVAENLSELISIQKQYGTSLLYEASSCGSIPIIRTLEEYYNNEHLNSISGIFNGSSNFILTKMNKENLTYNQALKLAQELGFAETDPTLDVGGYDAKYKLIILTVHAFGLVLKPSQILNIGIQTLSDYDFQFAKEKEWKIKLVPTAFLVNNSTITAFVLPRFINKEDYLYSVEFENNAVTVQAAFSQKQLFYGKGAGGHPTGSAVLSDISANAYHYKYEYKKLNQSLVKNFSEDISLKVYYRYQNSYDLDKLNFIHISEKYESENFKYAIGKVKLADIHANKDHILAQNNFIGVIG